MGMFDNIRCQHPLPDGYEPGERLFQTKDLDNTLSVFTITPLGRLISDVGHYEAVDPSNRPYPNEEGLKGLAGALQMVVDEENVDCQFDGEINFYEEDAAGQWRLYTAVFDQGQLLALTGGIDPDRTLPENTDMDIWDV